MTAAFAVWLTGLPASGKSTIARALERELRLRDIDPAILESDVLRPVLMPRATYSDDDRDAFYKAVVYVGASLVRHGVPVIFDATANRRVHRQLARSGIERFIEVHIDCPLAVCAARDPKGLYRRAQSGAATNMPGVQTTYEAPEHPELVVHGDLEPAEVAAQRIVRLLDEREYLNGDSPARYDPRAATCREP
jgi:adenylylsulfate kinase